MNQNIILFVLLLFSFRIFAEVPEKVSFQAIVRDGQNNLVTIRSIEMKISILQGSSNGNVVYAETQTPTTNINGLVSFEIGTGVLVLGNFESINWSNGPYFIKTETDTDGGNKYTISGTSQLISVPYAIHAKTVDNITETDPGFKSSVAGSITAANVNDWNNKLSNEIDGSTTNEIQALSIRHDTIFLSQGGFAKLPPRFDGNYNSLTNAPVKLSAFSNDVGYLTTEVDGSITNEIQTLRIGHDTIFLSNGGFVKLPPGFDGKFTSLTSVPVNLDIDSTNDFDGQYSSLSGKPTRLSAFSNDVGYLTTEVDGSITNEIQTLRIGHDTIFLSNGGFVKLPPGFDGKFTSLTSVPVNLDIDSTNDFDGQYSSLSGKPTRLSAFSNDVGYLTAEVDGSITNEIQSLSIAGTVISLSNGGSSVTLPASTLSLDGAYDNGRTITADAGAVTVAGTDGFVSTGATGIGAIPTTGAGTRMMWYPRRAAFRAGGINGVQWDDANIGDYSFASGNNNIANGAYSTAFGLINTASGFGSTSFGNSTTASGDGSVSMGEGSLASGANSTAMGFRTLASGIVSTAMGQGTTASGAYSVAMGNVTVASGPGSTSLGDDTDATGATSIATGFRTLASGIVSTAMGQTTTAGGSYSTAMGINTTANGTASTAMGFGTTADGDYSTAMGVNVSTNHKTGSFIIGDTSPTTANCDVNNQVMMRFNGGYKLYSNGACTIGTELVSGGNAWAAISDSTKKENFIPADGDYFLTSLSKLKLGSWNYKSQNPKDFRHYGPMAQEIFHYFGNDGMGKIGCDTLLNSSDMDGIMMICLKALEERTNQLQNKTRELEKANQRLEELEKRVADIENRIKNIVVEK
ncbi:MAG TPA: hypothetical protein DCY97_19365 [Marinilabiliales bacterium]|nr:hypothetical protein [Marinilabiliales bacterium]